MTDRLSDEELFALDLAAPNPELEGVDLLPQVRAAIAREQRAPLRAVKSPVRRAGPTPPGSEGKGKARLFLELYWGEQRQHARSFGDLKRPVLGAMDDQAAMPLWGFALPDGAMTLADGQADGYRLFVPPGAQVERRGSEGDFHAVTANDRSVTLANGDAVRLSSGDACLVAYVQPPLPRPWTHPLATLPLLTMGLVVAFTGLFAGFLQLAPSNELPDFTGKHLSPVAVRLMTPQPKKKEEARRKLEKLTKKTTPPKQKKVAIARPPALARAEHMKALQKISAAGPAMKDLLAAVDKLGNGPGKKNSYKMADLIGQAPLANPGLGTFGLGGGGQGGQGTRGLEVLRGKGGGGIGALGAGTVGKGAVGGTVSRASPRNLAASGSIDREAVAKAINSHLGEVTACYERALLREPGLAGKIVLQWNISTSGVVTTAKTKSSTMKSSAVEACILTSLKTWKFPPARGAGVVITYPFLFNSVGY